MNHVVIMAGGIGSRFWPLSTPELPKQFIDILGCGRTMIQMTIDRFEGICPSNNIWVVTNQDYVEIVKRQLPQVNPKHILAEPIARNTTPSIAWACWRIKQEDVAANVVITASDAIVYNQVEFRRVVNNCLLFTKNNDVVVTLGIKPTRPETGYGYIETKKLIDGEIYSVNAFKEKPDSKEISLLVSVKQVAECGVKSIAGISHHYLTHLCLNPSNTRVAFLHRYFMSDGGMMTRLMTVGVDGTELRCLAQGFLSHFDWQNDDTIYIFGRANSSIDAIRNNPILSHPLMQKPMRLAKKVVKSILNYGSAGGVVNSGKSFLLIKDSEQPAITPFAQGLIVEDGHPMTNPLNSDWCVNDTYPNSEGIRTLMLYQFSENHRIDLGLFKMIFDRPDMSLKDNFFERVDPKILSSITPEDLAFTRSGLHCDLHPRWSRDGRWVLFDSIHEGTRQLYAVDVNNLIK